MAGASAANDIPIPRCNKCHLIGWTIYAAGFGNVAALAVFHSSINLAAGVGDIHAGGSVAPRHCVRPPTGPAVIMPMYWPRRRVVYQAAPKRPNRLRKSRYLPDVDHVPISYSVLVTSLLARHVPNWIARHRGSVGVKDEVTPSIRAAQSDRRTNEACPEYPGSVPWRQAASKRLHPVPRAR